MSQIAETLSKLGHTLPVPKVPAANYLSYTLQDNLLLISGQIGQPGAARSGVVGAGLDSAAATREAQHAALGVLAVLNQVLAGDIGRLVQVLRVGVYIAAAPEFDQHSQVANGASDLLVAALGERGRHARTAIGVASLPAAAAVEVDAIVQIRPEIPSC